MAETSVEGIKELKDSALQEKQMKALVEDSCSELLATIAEYEKRLDAVNYENNEWKTRYDIQKETNDQISKQILIIQDKIQQSKNQLRDVQKAMRSSVPYESDLGDISMSLIKTLQEERDKLVRQKRDLDWRIIQENKAFHKANEQRKAVTNEILSATENINELKYMTDPGPQSPPRSPKQSVSGQPPTAPVQRVQRLSTVNPMIAARVPKLSTATAFRNIPPDQRIIDPKMGPIKKESAVKNLPPL